MKELNKRKQELLNRQEAILNVAMEAKRSLAADEEAEFAKNDAEIKDINTQLERHAAISAERAKIAQPTSKAVVASDGKKKLGQPAALTDEYFETFYGNFGRFERVRNELLWEGAESDTGTGGVVAPVVYEGTVIPLAPINMALRQLATVTPTSNDIKIPVQTVKSTAAVKAQSTTAASHDFSATNPRIKLVTLSAKMLGNYVPASLESLQDIGYLQTFVQSDISRAVLEAEESDYTDTLLDPANGATVYSATSPATATPQSFLDVVGAQPSAYDAGSSWLMPKRTGIALQKQQVGANQFNPFWAMVNGTPYFHGFPVYYSSILEDYGSPAADNVVFGNFKQGFIIGDRNNGAVLVKVDDITSFKSGIINIFGYRRSGSVVRNQDALRQFSL